MCRSQNSTWAAIAPLSAAFSCSPSPASRFFASFTWPPATCATSLPLNAFQASRARFTSSNDRRSSSVVIVISYFSISLPLVDACSAISVLLWSCVVVFLVVFCVWVWLLFVLVCCWFFVVFFW